MTAPDPAADLAPAQVRVFGLLLDTDRPLPGLPVAPPGDDGQFPFWHLRTADTEALPAHSPGAVVTGQLQYSSGPRVTLADAGRPEIVISDTGRFTLDLDDRRIVHHAPVAVDRAAVALDLIGVVLPYALHRDGAWCMHASAIVTSAGVVAFVAQRGTGKSTLAAACVQAGCALMADDVVVLRNVDGSVRVMPSGVPLRLRRDAAGAVGVTDAEADGWGKVRLPGAVTHRDLPLAAVYCLAASPADAAVARAPRTPRASAFALLTNGKITELLGGAAAGEALERCVALAARTPVYDLAVPRDLERLPEVVRAVCAWHADSVMPPMPA